MYVYAYMKENIICGMESLDIREPSLKELPTRELKLKRLKFRRDSPAIPPIRLRLKSNTSPTNSETETEKCFSDRSVSSSPDSVSQELSPVYPSSYKVSALVNSLPTSSATNEYRNDSCEAFCFASSSNFVEHEDYDQPLDMSRKHLQESSPSVEPQNFVQQQLRPSVITCASALLRTQCNLTDVAHHMCTSVLCNSNDSKDNQYNSTVKNDKVNNSDIKGVRPGHRREIVSGSCEPVIDEHFRRSLGKDYQHIFSKSSGNNVSVTVDDHFAKALGDTWHQLQQTKTVADSVTSVRSPNSIKSQQPPPFHQPPEILS